jgi:hypothetical protein
MVVAMTLVILPWESWIFIDNSSFLKRLFLNICNINFLLFFLENRSHKLTQCKGLYIFFTF